MPAGLLPEEVERVTAQLLLIQQEMAEYGFIVTYDREPRDRKIGDIEPELEVNTGLQWVVVPNTYWVHQGPSTYDEYCEHQRFLGTDPWVSPTYTFNRVIAAD